MKLKRVFQGVLAHHIMRHRQHHRFMRTIGAPVIALGRTKGMLLLGAVALAGEYMRRRKARQVEVPEYTTHP